MSRRKNADVIDRSFGFVQDLNNAVWTLPYDISNKTIQTTLDLKDAIKHQIGIKNPSTTGYVYRFGNGKWQYFATIRSESDWMKYRRLANNMPHRYRIVMSRMNPEDLECSCHPPASSNRRRNGARSWKVRRINPDHDEDLADRYARFHGKDSEEMIVIEKEFEETDKTFACGDLAECWVETPAGVLIKIGFPEDNMPLLTSNSEGTQLYIDGGDQSIDLDEFEISDRQASKDRVILGTFVEPSKQLEREQLREFDGEEEYSPWNIAYITEKDFDKFEVTQYQHDLGEGDNEGDERKESPQLQYDARNEQLYIEGGEYQIHFPIVGTSAGIEN